MKIAHLSDIHFGRIAYPHILDALIDEVNSIGVDLLAVSGDLTQRALHSQFKDAVAFLDKFTSPRLVVAGNHDVFPWWLIWSRFTRPVARFQKYFGSDLVRSFELPGLSVLGVNSAHGFTIKGGKITPATIDAAVEYFSRQPQDAFKIFMLHHHLIPVDALLPHDISQSGPRTFDALIEQKVDLVLCGHLHVSHVESLDNKRRDCPVIASAGTATSDRGRRSNKHRNFYNLIEIRKGAFTITERAYHPSERVFKMERSSHFEHAKSL